MPKKFPAASITIGADTQMNVLALGIVGVENPFNTGKIMIPRRNPAYIPKQRAHTAVGYPNTDTHLEGIW